jgi:hypothetical protein
MLTFIKEIIEKIMNSTYEGPWYGRPMLVVPVVFILSMSSCTVLTGLDDVAYRQVLYEHKAEQAAAIERLIADHGFNALAAKCAIEDIGKNYRTMCTEANELNEAKK